MRIAVQASLFSRLTKISFALVLGLLFCSSMFAQRTVTGNISSEDGEPLIGASIFVRGTSTGTVTDIDGSFSIEVPADGNTLVVSYTGYNTEEIPLTNEANYSITLSEGVLIDEVVVTGYAVENKRQTTGAVSTIKAEDLKLIPSGNVEQQLQGRAAGVTVITNGQPGSTSQIRVRGFGSFGGNQPLYIVDGVPVASTNFLSPDEIESTSVLKDPAAASIYGARAAAGVVVFQTKRGERGKRKMRVTYDGLVGFTDPNVGGAPEMLTPQEQADWTHIAYRNNAAANGTEPDYSHPQYGNQAQATLPDYLHANGQNGVRGSIDLAAIQAAFEADPENVFLIRPNIAGTNWYDEVTRIGTTNRHTLGFDGGTENGRYYFGLSMQEQQGILLNNDFSRYSFRANSEFDLTPWLRIGQNLQFTYRSQIGGFGGGGGIGGSDDESFILSAYRMPSVIPVFDEFGSYASTKAAGFNNPRNPVRQLEQNDRDDQAINANAFGNIYLELEPVKDLVLRSSIGGQYNSFYGQFYSYRYLGDSEPQASNGYSESSSYNFQYVFTNTASYNIQLGQHNVKALGGVEALNTGIGRNISGSGINPFSTDLDFVNLSTVQNPVVNSGRSNGVNFYSVFGKLDYNFNDKYYLTGVLRRDGSSRFGENERFGVFPAVSGAWRVSAEPFMQNVNFINDFKVRAGWGEMGNSNNVDPANQFSLYASSRGTSFYPIQGQNNGVDEGFFRSRIGNPNARWETSEMSNIGFDLSMFNDRLEISGDVWRRNTRDLLFAVPVAGVVGNSASAPAINIASMLNEGIDFQIIYRGEVNSDFSYEIVLNNAFLRNEITDIAPGQDFFEGGNAYRGIRPTRNEVGQPLSSFFGYNVIGYFNSEEEVQNSPEQAGKGLGRFRYEDTDGDGVITPDDRQFLGNPIPDYTGGYTLNLDYKNFRLNMFFYVALGVDIWNQSKWFTDFFGTFEGSGKGVRAKESWTPERGNGAAAPIWESVSNFSTSGVENSWYIENGDYLRMGNLGLSYTFDGAGIEKVGLSSLRLGVNATNLFTLTEYQGLDPGVGGEADTSFGIDVGNYPVTRGFNFTVNLGF